jgi:ribosome-associated protein
MGRGSVLMPSVPRKSPAPHAEAAPSILDCILGALEDAKAENTVHVDITGKSSLADHMIVASGRSNRHVGAVADQLSRAIKDSGFDKPRIEGLPHCDWVLIDAGDVIVHIFRPEVREFYNLEKMWAAEFPDVTSANH